MRVTISAPARNSGLATYYAWFVTPQARIRVHEAQCATSTGTAELLMTWRDTPPSTHSRNRECP